MQIIIIIVEPAIIKSIKLYKPVEIPMKVRKSKINNVFHICRIPVGV